jgi:UDP-3-O-[3-hydroxymyristoyl] N-acetylglucosamine deacetylase/UDP-3-O-[3-hydroxymyristoyl] N-acetylglucosamine deacetylase/3-hydroxyacyl-[acyl-carrier-protein] dehydratase
LSGNRDLNALEGVMQIIRERNEHTIAIGVAVTGRGYWSGRGVNVRFGPASAGSGIRFIRTDLPGRPSVAATTENRVDQALRTVLMRGAARVEMIEHIMAALYGLEIDNCDIEIDAEELPGLDGSSAAYVDALRRGGLVMQAKTRRQIIVRDRIRVGGPAAWVEVAPSPDGQFHAEYRLDYGPESPIPPQSFAAAINPHSFGRELGAARTFVTAEQAQQLRDGGLASHVTNRDLLVFGSRGPVDNLLRYPNECARHKCLDLVGDLSIIGADLIGSVVSHRGGHQLNGQMALQICNYAANISVGCRNAA